MSNSADRFVTRIYREEIPNVAMLNQELEAIALPLSTGDRAGLRWCETHGYPGYTSFASIGDLTERFRNFARLEKIIRRHASLYAAELHWDVRGKKPICDSLWVSVMPEGGSHTSHIHANSVISGTYYVAVPDGAGPLIFEDPRAGLLMAAPPRKKSAPRELRTHVSETPRPGTLLLWESWLRHEVPLNRARGNRISVSFNYVMG